LGTNATPGNTPFTGPYGVGVGVGANNTQFDMMNSYAAHAAMQQPPYPGEEGQQQQQQGKSKYGQQNRRYNGSQGQQQQQQGLDLNQWSGGSGLYQQPAGQGQWGAGWQQ